MDQNLKVSRYAKTILFDDTSIGLYSGLTGALIESAFTLDELKYLIASKLEKLSDANLDTLLQTQILVPATLNELSYISQRFNTMKYSNAVLSTTIIPTYTCNLGCSYCYQDKKSGSMSDEISDLTFRHICNSLNYPRPLQDLVVTWYGGEPMLEFNRILQLGARIQEHCARHEINYDSHIVTNGVYLTPERVTELSTIGVTTVQVTIDGSKDDHDIRRPLKNPKIVGSSFDAALAGIESALGNLSVAIRVNLDPTNISGTLQLLEDIERRGWFKETHTRRSIKMSFAYTSNFSGLSCRDLIHEPLTIVNFAKAELRLYKKLLRMGIDQLPYPTPRDYLCGAVDDNAIIIDCFGDLYKCWLDVGRNERSHGTVGEPINFLHHSFQKWASYEPTNNKDCRNCDYLPLCMSKCPAEAMETENQADNVCDRWKYTLEETLKLHYEKKISAELMSKSTRAS